MADDSEDVANVFAIPDFWQTSRWLDQLPLQDGNPFFSPFQIGGSKSSNTGLLATAPVAPDDGGFFKLAKLDIASRDERPDQTVSDEREVDSPGQTTNADTQSIQLSVIDNDANDNDDNDIWIAPNSKVFRSPTHKTWDHFLKGIAAPSQATLLTEAGPAAYDALLSWAEDRLNLEEKDALVVESKAFVSSLLALSQGRDSLLFANIKSSHSFQAALSQMRISGYSSRVLDGLVKQCMQCGTITLKLRSFIHRAYASKSTQCSVALASVLEEILLAVQHNLVLKNYQPRSLLQLQSTIQQLSSILNPFHELASSIADRHRDEDIMKLVYDHTYKAENSEDWLREVMQENLRRISAPWIKFLEEWIGTRREEGMPFTKSNVGEVRGFVRVDSETYTDDFGEEVEDVDFRLDWSKIPPFMPEDIIKKSFETGRSLRFLRSSHPNHPLAKSNLTTLHPPPEATWLFNWEDILDLEARVTQYQSRLLEAISNIDGIIRHEKERDTAECISNVKVADSLFALDVDGIEKQILASMSQLAAPIPSSSPNGSVSSIIKRHFLNEIPTPTYHADSTPHWSLIPVLSFGGIVSAQAGIVNKETLRLLFCSHDLRGHIAVQRDYHLFGDGVFCTRLSSALFDPDLERADRQAGVARQGGVMGLRLGGRDTWPPASSELRLALMGVLSESYSAKHLQDETASQLLSRDSSTLPGDMSFAVRDLSAEEIDKCMIPDSLEALDFLRLSYKPPPELSFIITPLILMQYDRIFKLLLRVLRMVYTVDMLWRDTLRSKEDLRDISYRFVRESHHFVTSISSYFLDTAIAGPWQAFDVQMDKIQAALDDQTDSMLEKLESPDQLGDLHSLVVKNITEGLFLRRKQEPVLKLLEDIFTTILDYAKITREADAVSESFNTLELYRKFRKRTQVFITVCRGLTEKTQDRSNRRNRALFQPDQIGENSTVAQLLLKLDINNYYTKGW